MKKSRRRDMTERFLTGTLKHQHRHSLRFTFNPDQNQSPYTDQNICFGCLKESFFYCMYRQYILLENSSLKVS